MQLNGSCQCGNMTFTLEWTPDPAEIPARVCRCTFCSAHAAVWTSHPSATLHVTIQRPSRVFQHTFASHTTQFHTCSECSDVPVATSLIDGQLFAVVNVNTLQHLDPARLRYSVSHFDGESLSARLTRRQQHWIAQVTFSSGAG